MLSGILVGLLVQGLAFTSAQQPKQQTKQLSNPQFLEITTIAGRNGESTLECWRLANPFIAVNTPGQQGTNVLPLGEATTPNYIILPPNFDGGLHTAPAVQFVWFTSGLAHVTLPSGKHEAWIRGGRNGLILAADTDQYSRDGHYTRYPDTQRETIGITVPLEGGRVPQATPLHEGPCREQSVRPPQYGSRPSRRASS